MTWWLDTCSNPGFRSLTSPSRRPPAAYRPNGELPTNVCMRGLRPYVMALIPTRSRLHSFLSSHRASLGSNCQEAVAMEHGNKRERTQSHEDRKAQKLMKRIENTQASQEAAREADTKRTLADYGKKIGS